MIADFDEKKEAHPNYECASRRGRSFTYESQKWQSRDECLVSDDAPFEQVELILGYTYASCPE